MVFMLTHVSYCFFSWPHLTADIKARRHETDPAFQATVLAMCAIVAARIRDGACNQLLVLSGNLNPDAEELQRAANAAAPALPLNRPPAFDDLRAAALLTVLAMQNGGLEDIHTTLGRYITLSALLDFHDERKWPADLAEWQLNERRALVRGFVATSLLTHPVLVDLHTRRLCGFSVGRCSPSPRLAQLCRVPRLAPRLWRESSAFWVY